MPLVLKKVTVDRSIWARVFTLGLLGKTKVVQQWVWEAPKPLEAPKKGRGRHTPSPSITKAPAPRNMSKTVVREGPVASSTYRVDDSSDDILPTMILTSALMDSRMEEHPERFVSGGGGDFGGGGASASWAPGTIDANTLVGINDCTATKISVGTITEDQCAAPSGWSDYKVYGVDYAPTPAPAPSYEPPAPSPSYESSYSSSSSDSGSSYDSSPSSSSWD